MPVPPLSEFFQRDYSSGARRLAASPMGGNQPSDRHSASETPNAVGHSIESSGGFAPALPSITMLAHPEHQPSTPRWTRNGASCRSLQNGEHKGPPSDGEPSKTDRRASKPTSLVLAPEPQRPRSAIHLPIDGKAFPPSRPCPTPLSATGLSIYPSSSPQDFFQPKPRVSSGQRLKRGILFRRFEIPEPSRPPVFPLRSEGWRGHRP